VLNGAIGRTNLPRKAENQEEEVLYSAPSRLPNLEHSQPSLVQTKRSCG